jgi:hypothetical protein
MDSIEKICEETAKTEAINACNSFIQKVASRLWPNGRYPATLAGRANDILAQLQASASFFSLGNAHEAATEHAEGGYFVLGGVIDTTGHIFVVVPGGPSLKGIDTPWLNRQTQQPFPSRGGMPLAFNGSTNPRLRIPRKFGVDLMFSPSKFSEIRYFAIRDPRLTNSQLKASSKLALTRTLLSRTSYV